MGNERVCILWKTTAASQEWVGVDAAGWGAHAGHAAWRESMAQAWGSGLLFGLAMRPSLSQGHPRARPRTAAAASSDWTELGVTQASLWRAVPEPGRLPVTALCGCFRGLSGVLSVQMPVANQYIQDFPTSDKTNTRKPSKNLRFTFARVYVCADRGTPNPRQPPALGKAAELGQGRGVR